MPRPWATNAGARIREFIERRPDHIADIEKMVEVAQRLGIDPYDIRVERDSANEWHCVIGPSEVDPNYILGVSYLISNDRREVNVISFYGWYKYSE